MIPRNRIESVLPRNECLDGEKGRGKSSIIFHQCLILYLLSFFVMENNPATVMAMDVEEEKGASGELLLLILYLIVIG